MVNAHNYDAPSYWDGTGTGYKGDGYRDFPSNQWRADYIAAQRPGRVLEVGCAYGYLVKALRDRGIDAWGMDISRYALDQAPREVRPYLRQGDANDLPFKPGTFNYLTSFGMLEHLAVSQLPAVMQSFQRVAPRGLLSVTLSTDPLAQCDPSHHALLSYQQWQCLVPPGYQLWTNAEESWDTARHHNLALVAPAFYPLGQEGYGGIERLALLFLRGLLGSTRTLTCACPEGSLLPRGVQGWQNANITGTFEEHGMGHRLLPLVPQTSCWLDFSHSKALGRLKEMFLWSPDHPLGQSLDYTPHISVIWHDPYIMRPPQPRYNVAALSEWQAQRFREVYQRECRVIDPICGDGDYFRPGVQPEDFLLFIGKLGPDKGCLEAIRAARQCKQRLHIVGPVTPGDPADYVAAVLRECDGDQVVYHGEVSEPEKLDLLQRAKALLYPVSYPSGQGEAHSHKTIEALLCGTPAVLFDQGAMAEVVQDGVDGFVIPGSEALPRAVQDCEALDRERIRERALARWDYRQVVRRWLPVIQDVIQGDRW